MDDVQIMGSAADEYVTMLGAAASAGDVLCAGQVKGGIYAAAGCTVGTLGMGLFGTYKLFKGRPAAGVTSLLAGGILFFLGRALAANAARDFEACRTAGPTTSAPPLTLAQERMQELVARGQIVGKSASCTAVYPNNDAAVFSCMREHPGGIVTLP